MHRPSKKKPQKEEKSPSLSALESDLAALADPVKAKILARFFKTGQGEYGEGDRFLGITVPLQRGVAKKYRALPLAEIEKLLASAVHEHRFTALEILVMQYEAGDEKAQEKIFKFYLKQTGKINNWDLVDTSARYIVGRHLFNRDRALLYKLANSKSLWERRIAIVSTHYFISQGDVTDTFRLAEVLMGDRHDLIHKAVGWMLREAGKKSPVALLRFLDEYAPAMPRTMLRYAIERLEPAERRLYLNLKALD